MLHAHHHNRIRKRVFLAVAVLFSYTQSAVCQQDSIDILQSQLQTSLQQLKQARQKYATDSIAFEKQILSLKSQLNAANRKLEYETSGNDTVKLLAKEIKKQQTSIQNLKKDIHSVTRVKDSLMKVNSQLIRQLNDQNDQLIEKVRILQEKELQMSRNEGSYRDSIGINRMTIVRMEGLLKAQEVNVAAKAKEVDYLRKEIDIRDSEIVNQKADYRRVRISRDRYINLNDSLREKLVNAEKVLLQKEEELKYTKKRAEDAEAKINASTNKKKKVRVIQGIAMRTFRTPDWYIRPDAKDGDVVYRITNKNSGNVEFDFITGASVMLWDLTPYFHSRVAPKESLAGWRRFDQEFSYDLGVYVGFGGSNLFKNFYFGPSFKFMDFFHFTMGANIAEYEVLAGDYKEGDILEKGFSIKDQIVEQWKVTFFLALSLDLDFLSYIKK